MLIDRDKAIEAIDEVRDLISVNAYCAITERLKELPSAERTGEWIEKEDPYGFFDAIPVCSECGCTTKMRERYNYCPNCGARMVSEDDSRRTETNCQ